MTGLSNSLLSAAILTLLCSCGDDTTAEPLPDAGATADDNAEREDASTSDDPSSDDPSSDDPSSDDPSSDDPGPGPNEDAGPSLDSGVGACEALGCVTTLPRGEDDGVLELCQRVVAEGNEEQCGALEDECRGLCDGGNGMSRPDAGAAVADACDQLGDHCHEPDDGSGLANLCHETGHSGNAQWCEAIYDECATVCEGLGGEADAGHGQVEDAGHGQVEDAGHPELDASVDGGGPAQALTLNFAAVFGDEAFACGETYEDQGTPPTVVTPQDLRLYVTDVRLVTATGDEVPFELEERAPFQGGGVALLDFEDGTGECRNGNAALNTTVTGMAPAGEYTGISFSTSVPVDLNHEDPTTLPAPLRAGEMTWGWLYGFKFIKAEVLQVADDPLADSGASDASVPVPGAGLVHLGSTGCSNLSSADAGEDFAAPPSLLCSNENRNRITLSGFAPTSSVILADLSALFADTDLTVVSMCHSTGEACPPVFESAGVDYATGTALSTQTLFRLE
jgi:uncharacterized repeat protein (TIGR04052 family)